MIQNGVVTSTIVEELLEILQVEMQDKYVVSNKDVLRCLQIINLRGFHSTDVFELPKHTVLTSNQQ